MIKCLHILPMDKLSGAERVALIICKNSNNYKPIVLCGGESLEKIFKKEGIESYSLDFSKTDIFKIIKQIKLLVVRTDIRIVHAHDNKASIYAYLVKKIYKLDIKVISHIHSCYPYLENSILKKKIDSFFRKRYDCNIVCGYEVYKFHKRNSRSLIEEKTFILSNSLNIDELKKYEIKEKNICKLKEDFRLEDKIVFGFVGRICEIKGIIPLIKEVSTNKKNLNDCKILLIGDGEQDNEVQEIIEKDKLGDIIIKVGFQENVYQFYPLIDIFILPSLYEGLPMVLLEAMSFKNCIISMNVGGIHELIKDGENGFLIPKADYAKFVQTMIELKNNYNLREKISINGYKHVLKNYDIKEYIKKLDSIYLNILN